VEFILWLQTRGQLLPDTDNMLDRYYRQKRRLTQARRQDIAAGGQKKEGPHFKNTVLDICSNQGAKREMGGTDFKWGGRAPLPPRWRRPWSYSSLATTILKKRFQPK